MPNPRKKEVTRDDNPDDAEGPVKSSDSSGTTTISISNASNTDPKSEEELRKEEQEDPSEETRRGPSRRRMVHSTEDVLEPILGSSNEEVTPVATPSLSAPTMPPKHIETVLESFKKAPYRRGMTLWEPRRSGNSLDSSLISPNWPRVSIGCRRLSRREGEADLECFDSYKTGSFFPLVSPKKHPTNHRVRGLANAKS